MDIGVSLPTMAPGYGPTTTVDWSRAIDAGPYSSVSAGERITFSNPELFTTMAAAAAVTERVDVFLNLVVSPLHATPVIAKQVGTIDQLANGRTVLGVGIGGRGHDYRAADAPFAHRHARLDEQVHELRRLWSGEPPFEGADPVEPAPLRDGGPPILAGALGPKAMARAAAWADGVTGFSVSGRGAEMRGTFDLAEKAWADAGRSEAPRKVSGAFYAAGIDDPAETLRAFTFRYLRIFGDDFAQAMADDCWVSTPEALAQLLDDAEEAGCDEVVLVPATVDLACLHATTEVVSAR
jgi:alkanesulfonate monooxygenase SsuD/methylene tetrahydromethanopterin reductase-like flavin-dependent oxidoreductase (luciferase family)